MEIEYPEFGGIKPETTGIPIISYAKYLFSASISLIGVIAFIVLILAGIRYLTSSGNPEAKKAARKQILSAVFGIAILLLSYLILTTINPELIVLRWLSLEQLKIAPLAEIPTPPSRETSAPTTIETIAKTVSGLASGIVNTAKELENQTSQCNCSSGQSMCLCQGGGKEETPTSEKTQVDLVLPYDISSSSLEEVKQQSLPGSLIYTSEDTPLSSQQRLQSITAEAQDVFTPQYQDNFEKTPIYFFNNEDFIQVLDNNTDNMMSQGLITERQADVEKLNSQKANAVRTYSGIVIVNQDKFGGEDYMKPVLIHEYGHVVDGFSGFGSTAEIFTHEQGEKGIGRLSYSPEYFKIYNKANILYGENVTEAQFSNSSVLSQNSGFVSDYARTNVAEDFAETIREYSFSRGDPAKISSDPTSQQLIQERFDFLKKQGVVK